MKMKIKDQFEKVGLKSQNYKEDLIQRVIFYAGWGYKPIQIARIVDCHNITARNIVRDMRKLHQILIGEEKGEKDNKEVKKNENKY